MAQNLADQFGGSKERRAPVAGLTFGDGYETGNVMTAVDADGEPLFQFGWRPFHDPTIPKTREGLFLC